MSSRYPEVDLLDLDRRQIYPRGDRLSAEALLPPKKIPIVDRATPIVSIGSCFASRIKVHLVEKGYNYVQTSSSPAARPTSAAWGTVFNAFCVRQEFERALGRFYPNEVSWRTGDGFASPYRKGVEWSSLGEGAEERKRHERESREALEAAELVIVTLGLVEIWYNLVDRSVFYQVPPADVFDPATHGFRVADQAENADEVRKAIRALREINPGVPVVLTVSPVPLRATFRKQIGAVAANVHSKATLVGAARFVAEAEPDVYYFPSFELVTAVLDDPYKADNRHVTPETEVEVMKLFEKTYLR